MARALQLVADALPLTYAYDALARVSRGTGLGGRFAIDLAVTLGGILVALALGAATLRRRTP
jgi:ABC-2 type transport system permease protein